MACTTDSRRGGGGEGRALHPRARGGQRGEGGRGGSGGGPGDFEARAEVGGLEKVAEGRVE